MEIIARTITKTRCYEIVKVNQTGRDYITLGMIISILRYN